MRTIGELKERRYLYKVKSTSKAIPKIIEVLANNEEEAYETVLNTIKDIAKDEILDPIVLNLESITTRIVTKELVEESEEFNDEPITITE